MYRQKSNHCTWIWKISLTHLRRMLILNILLLWIYNPCLHSCRYRSDVNKLVADELTTQLTNETDDFEPPVIKRKIYLSNLAFTSSIYMYLIFSGAIYRYYESRRRRYLDSRPSRVSVALLNKTKTRKSLEQQRVSITHYKLTLTCTIMFPITFHCTVVWQAKQSCTWLWALFLEISH